MFNAKPNKDGEYDYTELKKELGLDVHEAGDYRIHVRELGDKLAHFDVLEISGSFSDGTMFVQRVCDGEWFFDGVRHMWWRNDWQCGNNYFHYVDFKALSALMLKLGELFPDTTED